GLARYFEAFKPEFKSIAYSGWGAELIPDADILQSQFPDVLEEMDTKRARIAELTALFAAADEKDEDESADDEDEENGVLPSGQVKALKDELKELNATWKTAMKELKALTIDLFTEFDKPSSLSGLKKGYLTKGMNAKTPDFASGQIILDAAKSIGHTSDYIPAIQQRMRDGQIGRAHV